MGLLNRYEKIRMDKNAILKAESRNRSGGKKRMNRTIRVSAAVLRISWRESNCIMTIRFSIASEILFLKISMYAFCLRTTWKNMVWIFTRQHPSESPGGRSSPHIPSTKFRRSIGVCYRISKSVRGNAHIWSFCRSSLVWTVETQKKIFHTWQTKKTAEKIAEYLTRVSKRYGTEWEYKEGRIVLHA